MVFHSFNSGGNLLYFFAGLSCGVIRRYLNLNYKFIIIEYELFKNYLQSKHILRVNVKLMENK